MHFGRKLQSPTARPVAAMDTALMAEQMVMAPAVAVLTGMAAMAVAASVAAVLGAVATAEEPQEAAASAVVGMDAAAMGARKVEVVGLVV